MVSLSPQEKRDFITRMDKALLPLFTKCVVPIFGEQNGAAIQCGTGTLFRVAGISFLVTASHVADIRTKHRIQLYISDGLEGAPGIALEGRLHSEANFDVAILELPETIIKQLSNRKFLSVHNCDRARRRITNGWYYIHGYPNCWSETLVKEKKTTVRNFTYGTALYEGPCELDGYDPASHLLLEVPKDKATDVHGAEAELPSSLKGISGCSLWQAYCEGLHSKDWNVDDATIVAVQTGTLNGGAVIKGTRWWVVNNIICKKYPEFSKALSLITPHKRLVL